MASGALLATHHHDVGTVLVSRVPCRVTSHRHPSLLPSSPPPDIGDDRIPLDTPGIISGLQTLGPSER